MDNLGAYLSDEVFDDWEDEEEKRVEEGIRLLSLKAMEKVWDDD